MRRWAVSGLVLSATAILVPSAPAAAEAQADGPREAASEAAGGSADAARSAPACAKAVARKVQSHYQAVRDLTARFTQSSQMVSLGMAPAESGPPTSGEVSFAKPGKMRWSYETPEESLVVTDGEELWLFEPERQEAQRLHSSRGFLSGAALQFLLGQGDMARDFRVRALACADGEATLELVPKKVEAYEKLEIRVDPGTGEIRETAVFDLVGNVTRVAFENVRTNTGLTDDVFRFTPPSGVRVVEVPVGEP